MAPIDLQATAVGGGYYRVLVDGAEHSKHTAEREAIEEAFEVKRNRPSAVVEYVHDYRVTVEEVVVPDPVPPTPPPPPTPPSGPVPAFVEDFAFADLAALRASGRYGTPTVTPEVTHSVDDVGVTPWGGTRALGFHVAPSAPGGGLDFGEVVRFPIPANTREVWIRSWHRWSAGWDTQFPGGQGNPDQKHTFYDTDFWPAGSYPNPGRISTKVGTYPDSLKRVTLAVVDGTNTNGSCDFTATRPAGVPISDYQAMVPPRTGTAVDPRRLWDGAWHERRIHLRAPDPGQRNGIFREWWDGVLDTDITDWSCAIGTAGGFVGMQMGRYLNHRPNVAQVCWFGRIEVYTSNPGW